MNAIFVKISNAVRTDGFFYTIYRCLRFPFVRLKSFKNRRKIFLSSNTAEVFTKIYEVNWWGSRESISGFGSTLDYTENLRKELPKLFRRLSIKTVFDAPCGDFKWMSKVVDATDIDYIGADIVKQLIDVNQASFSNDRTRFLQLNIITDEFPEADLWVCRDCLIHLSFKDIYQSLSNYIDSGIPYILTTTHINSSGFRNTDIQTGDARMIDLFSEPFFFPKECQYRIDDWVKPHPPREMIMFDREQVIKAHSKMKQALEV